MEVNEGFRKALQAEFSERAEKNPAYSIRSFAKSLDVESSSLAQILAGKRKLTEKMCLRLGTKLGFSPLKIKALLKSETARVEQFSKFSKLNDDVFKVISDWQYYAILELIHCDDFKVDIRWIAQTLGLSFALTLESVNRLKRLNYLEVTADGRWIDRLGDANNLGNEFKTPAFTEHQRQVLTKAKEALDKVPYEERVQSSMTLVGSKSRVREAKAMILNFIEELDQYMKSGRAKDEVYEISVSLFPVSENKKGEKK